MSRSGYNEGCENDWQLIMWRGAVASATRGRRGQKLLRELLEALDAMPEKRLIANDLERRGEVCALGALGRKRGIDMSGIDPSEYDKVSVTFDAAQALVREIEWMNDEGHYTTETPEQRHVRMRQWVAEQIKEERS